MPELTPEQLAQQIHAAGMRFVIAVTGGGSGAISALLGVAGASRSVLAAAVPYAAEALAEWLGATPDEYCSAATARAMAMAAFERARRYDPVGNTCGVACTASLASDRPKRGAHRAHLAFQTATTTATASVEFEKGRRSRAEEEALLSTLVLNLIAEAAGAAGRLGVSLAVGEPLTTVRVVGTPEEQDLLAGRTRAVSAGASALPPAVLFPGAFHPLHQGHTKMAGVARRELGQDVAFEISIENVDKPPLDFQEIRQRLRQFPPEAAVWLTRAPRFADKAELFPGSTFVVGADTITRIGQPRYYGGSESAMETAILRIAARGCRFLVFGRLVEGRFRTLADLQLPPELAGLCRQVPEVEFHEDISSTELRHGKRTE